MTTHPHHSDTRHEAAPSSPADFADRLLDANLARLGRAARNDAGASGLTVDELDAIKSGAAPVRSGGVRDFSATRPVERRVGAGFWAGLSAAAATVAIGGVLFSTHAPSSRVNAATIMSSLRARTISGADIVFKAFDTGEVTVDGRMQARLPQPVDAAMFFAEAGPAGARDPRFEELSIGGRLDLTIDDQPARGMVFTVDLGFSPASRWMYMRTGPAQTHSSAVQTRSAPSPAGFEGLGLAAMRLMFKNGVLLDFTGLDLDALAEAQAQREAMFAAGSGEASDPAPGTPGTITIGLSGSGLVVGATPPSAGSGAAENSPLSPLDDIARGTMGLLSGRADSAELQALQQALDRAGKQALVEDLGDGRYVLTAQINETFEGGIGSVRVEYQRNAGVESVEFFSNRDGGGSIVVTLPSTPIDPALLQSSSVVRPGAMVIDSRMLGQWMGVE